MRERKRGAHEAHRDAMDDLQQAVDRTMEPGDLGRQRADLRRAAKREQRARGALSDEPRSDDEA